MLSTNYGLWSMAPKKSSTTWSGNTWQSTMKHSTLRKKIKQASVSRWRPAAESKGQRFFPSGYTSERMGHYQAWQRCHASCRCWLLSVGRLMDIQNALWLEECNKPKALVTFKEARIMLVSGFNSFHAGFCCRVCNNVVHALAKFGQVWISSSHHVGLGCLLILN